MPDPTLLIVGLAIAIAGLVFLRMEYKRNAEDEAELDERCARCGVPIIRKRDVRVEPHRGWYVDADGNDTCSNSDRNSRGRFHIVSLEDHA